MAHYMIQAAYTPDAWAALSNNPQNRADALRPVVESLGGAIWRASTWRSPSTPLLTVEEGMEAMAKSGASGYTPPQ